MTVIQGSNEHLLVSARDLNGRPASHDTWDTPFDLGRAVIRQIPFPYAQLVGSHSDVFFGGRGSFD